MEFDLSSILLGLLLAFILGWTASRLDIRQLRFENRQNPKAYFKGLNYLLNEQQDQAIDAFIQAVQLDPDTTELHFALGNLFRRRGEFERAVRVHEHLLARGDLSVYDQERAQQALTLDYLKAGLLDRAEEGFEKLISTRFKEQSQLALLSIYERTRDYANALLMANDLEGSGQGDFKNRQAHYLCEQAAISIVHQDTKVEPEESQRKVRNLLQQAISIAPHHPRARIDLADFEHSLGQTSIALQIALELFESSPSSVPLICDRVINWARALGQVPKAQAALAAFYENSPSLDVLKALASLEPSTQKCQALLSQHLKKEPSLLVASWWLDLEKLEHETVRPALQQSLSRATQPLNRYRCAACGFEAQKHFWQCPGCQAWDSYPSQRVEEL
jgi:lipopolysaccharide biosynthesis regulator YciM